MDVYDRINELPAGSSIFVDLHDTLLFGGSFGAEVNLPLVEALIAAQRRGIAVCLWTAGTFNEALHGVNIMAQHGLAFEDVFCNVLKPAGLIIDNIAVNPNDTR